MSKSLQLVVAAVLLLAAASYSLADDVAEIHASGKAFAQAVASGDCATAKKYAITNEGTLKLLDAMGQISAAHKKLMDAAVAKFGEEGKTVFPGQYVDRSQQLEKGMEYAKVDVNGDTATMETQDGQQPVVFKKVDGKWKIDFTNIPHWEQMRQGIPIMTAVATAMDETAGEITNGKYKTVSEARHALFRKMEASSEFRRLRSQPRPTSQPDDGK